MKLFVSYPSDQQDLAERLRLALEAEGHEVFTDRAELRAGEAYHEKLRKLIEDSEAIVFLITPRAVSAGRYTLSELDIAQRRWRRPSGHVLPVLVEPTPLESIPPYLKAVTLLQPKGDLVAETVAAVAQMRTGWSRRVRMALVAAAGALAVSAAGGWWMQREHARAAEAAAQAQAARELDAQAQSARGLCLSGSHTAGWDALRRAADAHPGAATLQQALQDCGMAWLRAMRATQGKTSFGEQVDRIQPVLAQGLAAAAPQRRATLRAHIGWADFLRSRDGVAAPDPTPQYQAALADDPDNVYAHAMWAHGLFTSRSGDAQAGRGHFSAALRTGAERAWVRQLQWGAALWSGATKRYLLDVADDMRRSGEALSDEQRRLLWREAIYFDMPSAQERRAWLAALPAADWQATFAWAFARPEAGDTSAPLWRFTHAVLDMNAGARGAALEELSALKRELVVSNREPRLRTAIDQLIGELRTR